MIARSETSGTYSSYPTFMETCILFFSISAILTVFEPTPFPIDEEYCAIIILSCDNILPNVPVTLRPKCERRYKHAWTPFLINVALIHGPLYYPRCNHAYLGLPMYRSILKNLEVYPIFISGSPNLTLKIPKIASKNVFGAL